MFLHALKMEDWQLLRVVRSQREDIKCDVWDSLDHGTFLFGVFGKTREAYDVVIDESVELWPPTCTCLDNVYRPFLCKHIRLCLAELGAPEEWLADWYWTPEQEDVYDWLSNAPYVVD